MQLIPEAEQQLNETRAIISDLETALLEHEVTPALIANLRSLYKRQRQLEEELSSITEAHVRELEAKLRQVEGKQGGEVLFMQLCSRLIGHITSADVKCDPPTDIELRLVSIIRERDQARAALREFLMDADDVACPETVEQAKRALGEG